MGKVMYNCKYKRVKVKLYEVFVSYHSVWFGYITLTFCFVGLGIKPTEFSPLSKPENITMLLSVKQLWQQSPPTFSNCLNHFISCFLTITKWNVLPFLTNLDKTIYRLKFLNSDSIYWLIGYNYETVLACQNISHQMIMPLG